jgi:hypothetical protein
MFLSCHRRQLALSKGKPEVRNVTLVHARFSAPSRTTSAAAYAPRLEHAFYGNLNSEQPARRVVSTVLPSPGPPACEDSCSRDDEQRPRRTPYIRVAGSEHDGLRELDGVAQLPNNDSNTRRNRTDADNPIPGTRLADESGRPRVSPSSDGHARFLPRYVSTWFSCDNAAIRHMAPRALRDRVSCRGRWRPSYVGGVCVYDYGVALSRFDRSTK